MIKLDYSIESPEERKALVEKIIEETPNISPRYLEILADYLVLCMEKKERKEKKILTDNRMATVNKRECSFEGLVSQLENGEDGIYNLISDNKHTLLQPKISITKHDIETIPPLKELRDQIDVWEEKLKKATGKSAFIIKKMLIEMRKDQYIIKQGYQHPIVPCKLTRSGKAYIPLDEKSYIDNNREVHIEGISLMDTRVVSTILCNYSKMKEDSYDAFDGDLWYLMQDFDDICGRALESYPIYSRIVELKIDKVQNAEIKDTLQLEFGMSYSVEYISSLWRNKIPKLIATKALEDFIYFEYEKHDYPMKKCSKCGQEKPAHNQFFSKNKTSKDGFYSICKSCRSKKRG